MSSTVNLTAAFNDFLFASVGEDRNDMPLSVVSTLARLNLDPWAEAAELALMPADGATRRLSLLLAEVSDGCARLQKPGGTLVFTVIGRVCPWEIVHYARKWRWPRLRLRFARNVVPVGMNKHTIWTRYYTPREFYRAFERDFALEHYRGLCVFAPPPYLTWVRDRYPRVYEWLWRLDRRTAGWPLLRSIGDHFLIVMRRR